MTECRVANRYRDRVPSRESIPLPSAESSGVGSAPIGRGEVARPTKRQEASRDDALGERRRGARSKPIQTFSLFVLSFFPSSYSVLLSHMPPIAPAPRSRHQGGRVGGRGA